MSSIQSSYLAVLIRYSGCKRYRVSGSSIDQCLQPVPDLAGRGFGHGDDQAVVAGFKTCCGQLGSKRQRDPAACPGEEDRVLAGLQDAELGELVTGVRVSASPSKVAAVADR